MKYVVKIDRDSIKKNPNAGFTGPYYVPGKTFEDGCGGYSRALQAVYSTDPEPEYFYHYKPGVVVCEYCESTFTLFDLFTELRYDEEGEEYSVECCPSCNEVIDVGHEDINEVVKEMEEK